eukprot:TRINITY_DN2047_c0_g2_i1.p1 TRINITY_DN2047_c0_g2~~TRINITY_DN2047_c0_g2_i1.p1  ORF type:complete len:897 (+),score=222.81 TRINITY_DN2047_c0_g2_i1:61-2751(+)
MGGSESCCSGESGRAAPETEFPKPSTDPTMAEDNIANIASPRRHDARKGRSDRIGGAGGDLKEVASEEELLLARHRKPRGKNLDTQKLIKIAMKQDRICGLLDEPELEAILQAMEYFEFDAGETIVEQGQPGSRFMVTHEGALEVRVNGQVCNKLARGTAFGGISLLYNCPRTATVTSTQPCALWAASHTTFHKVLKESAQKHYEINRKLLESIRLFSDLTPKQKDAVGEAVFTEVFEANARVVTQGEDAPTMHLVKTGALSVLCGGTVSPTGQLVGGTEVSKLGPSDCFGERALLQSEPRSATVVATMRSEVLCIGAEALRDVLGTDLAGCIERNFILLGLKASSIFSKFNTVQQAALAAAMVSTRLEKTAPVGADTRFLVVLDGALTGTCGGKNGPWSRGQWLEAGESASSSLAAGPEGAKVSVLTAAALAKVLQDLGLSGLSSGAADAKSGAEAAEKLGLARKVHIFRHLSQDQLLKVVSSFVVQRFKKGECVFTQGEAGTRFYVIASGEVTVKKDGNLIRTMGKNDNFGERALLFDEPRSATVEVSSGEVELWYTEKATFAQIVKGNMQQDLMRRIELQDTNITLKDVKQLKVIGAGATGVVRLVQHKTTGTRYALKRVKKEKKGTIPEEVKRECELLAENDHPFIMKLVKTFDTPKGVYMLTELITGGELHGAIRQIPTVLSRRQSQFYTGSLVIVLEELSDRNIVYRDLKPENVMVDQQGYLKLIDFGIAKKLEYGKTKTFTMVGTPHYMAPEVMRGQGYGTTVDLWSLGVILFEFVCGCLPFADDLDDPTEVCAAVLKAQLVIPSRYRDPSGRALMQGLLCRQPKKRCGAGPRGYEEVRKSDYFKDGGTTPLFDRILGRELDAPWLPKGETYCDPEDAKVVLSDTDVLG